MPVLPFVLGWIVLAAEPTPPIPAGYLPTGSPVELYDLGRLALLRDPEVRLVSFHPSDRVEGADCPPREENGGTVLAETDGPGVIQRLWFTDSSADRPDLLGGKGEHLRIYLDRRSRPALDIPLRDLCAGKHPHFPGPMAGEWAGGFVCYVPIAFRDGCKVVVDGRNARSYQINLLKLPSAAGITTFTETPTEAEAAALKRARALWLEPEALWSNEPPFSRNVEWRALSLRRQAEEAEYAVNAGKRSTQLFLLPDGPRTIRALEVIPTPKTADAWRSSRLRLIWESDDPADAGVDLPLGLAFGRADRSMVYRSLMVGQDAMTWYNYFPMPYRRQALLQIDAEEPIQGLIRVRTLPGVKPGAGYFRARYRASSSSKPGADFEWLNEVGRGHYAGVFLEAEGQGKLSRWLDRVDWLTSDGRPALRGTGLAHAFNGGWHGVKGRLDQAQVFPLSGFPVLRQEGMTSRAAAYRWHLTDPVPFAHSVTAAIGHGHDNTFAADDRAAAFWYSERPGPVRAHR